MVIMIVINAKECALLPTQEALATVRKEKPQRGHCCLSH